ncbi:MAG: CHAT domain-containing protein [Actinomycetota bacterium]
MAGDGLSIEMLPARHGDALWIEWGGAGDRHRMLIDGGPAGTYHDLRERFEALDPTDRHVELFIVTHIDADHIDGAIRLLADEELGIGYGDIWFNEHRHLVEHRAEERATRGAMQGEYFGAIVETRGLPLNEAFDGRAVVVPPQGSLPSVTLTGGLRLVLLSPTPAKLDRLRRDWEKVLEEKGMTPGDRAEALDRLAKRGRRTRGGDRTTFGGDTSSANGSSIAVVAEYRGERWLLAGDAHDDVLIEGLRRYARECDESPTAFDGFKVPHHGSVNNITPELLDLIRCHRFLVSTNGAYFKHPDENCIDLIVRTTDRPVLVFNYQTDFNRKWASPSSAYDAVHGDGAIAVPAMGEADRAARRRSATPTDQNHEEDVVADANDPDGPESELDGPDGPADAGGGTPADPAESARDTVKVTVYHGSLERADHPVLVGHYLGTPLSGAEGFVDRRFLGRLTDRFVRGGYPGAVGESLLIRATRRRHPRSGVLVVGLGEYGELTPLRLVATVRQALIEYALNAADERDETETLELGISSVLLGATGDQGVSVSAAVRAIVTAVREANLELRGPDGEHRVRFHDLTLWERGGAEAELAFRALVALNDDAPSHSDPRALDRVVCDDELRVARGALRNGLRSDAEEASWWRVRVRELPDDRSDDETTRPPYLRLEYAVGGRLARTGNVVHLVERRRLERLLRETVDQTDPGSTLHVALFELLFPNELKWDMTAAQDIQLEVDDSTADVPWEMLSARNPGSGRGQLALRAPMVRQLRLPDFRAVQRATTATALVIGNPPAGRLGPLLGAFTEANNVATLLDERGYEVTSMTYDPRKDLPDNPASEIETALLAHDYRIIHIAAHGIFQPDDPTRSGVVIGPDEYLTAQLFKQVDVTPDLVFVNCCHLAGVAMGLESGAIEFTRQNLNRLGASLARELIDSGVRSVVVAGWAVDDLAADAFAQRFYEEMLAGATFGRAVHGARKAAFAAAEDHSTWGAYQCYGDGGYRLPREGGRAPDSSRTEAPITVAEARRRIESLVNGLESVGTDADLDQAKADLDDIDSTADDRGWIGSDDGRLCEDLATGWAAVGDFARAIARLDDALGASGGRATLKSLEQRANLKGRHAAKLLRNAVLSLLPSPASRRKEASIAQDESQCLPQPEQRPLSLHQHEQLQLKSEESSPGFRKI